MKKFYLILLALLMTACTTKAVSEKETAANNTGNYTDEMKIEDNEDLDPEAGSDSVERAGDHKGSPYFTSLDYYNMTSNGSLSILPKFKTIQQSSEWSCGVASALMVMDFYGKRGILGEEDIAKLRSNGLTPGPTSVKQAVEMFEGVGGYTVESNYDHVGEDPHEVFPLSRFKEEIQAGNAVMVCWIEWGGHWQVVIGYDDMGTETTQDDVMIMADPYDTTDHNQDGYFVYGAERFYYNWSMYDFFAEEGKEDYERNALFVLAKPEK